MKPREAAPGMLLALRRERLRLLALRRGAQPDPLHDSPFGSPREAANRARWLRVELAQIEESLANPVEHGREWDRRRAQLEARADIIRQNLRSHGQTVRR